MQVAVGQAQHVYLNDNIGHSYIPVFFPAGAMISFVIQ